MTSTEQLVILLSRTGHQYLPLILNGGDAVDNFKFQLYPFRDKTRGGDLRIDVRITVNQQVTKKSFLMPRKFADKQLVYIKNKKGDSFEIPLDEMLKISMLLNTVSEKVKSGESIDTLMKPNPTIAEFVNKYFRKKWTSKNLTEKGRMEHLLKYWGEYKVKNVYSLDIERYKMEMLKKLAPITLCHYYILLKQIFKLALELLVKSLCERFLRKLFERKKKQKKPVKILMTGLKTDFFKIYFFLFIRVSAHNFKRD